MSNNRRRAPQRGAGIPAGGNAPGLEFGHFPLNLLRERQRRSVPKPRVGARHERLPWVETSKGASTPTGLRPLPASTTDDA